MPRKHNYIGGIIGADPLVSSAPRPGVSNLGALGGDGAGYAIDHSLRLDATSDYMKFPQGTPTSSNTWTFSCWVKRSANSGGSGTPEQMLLAAGSNSSNYNQIAIANNDTLRIRNRQNGVWYRRVYTTDTVTVADGWTHIVVSTDPISVYINGQVPAIEPPTNSSGASWPYINASGYDLHIGRDGHAAQNYFNGQLAEVHFIDGTTYDPTEFGELVGGVWYPKEVTGLTYGNNGFYLDFADNNTASALGTDVSGNNPANNFSVTGIATHDQLIDSPNLRFATLDPDFRGGLTGEVLSEGNLKYYCPPNKENYVAATLSKTTGKWYFECLYDGSTNNSKHGIVGWTYTDIEQLTETSNNPLDDDVGGMLLFDGRVLIDTAAATSTLQATSANDVFGVAFDADTREIWFSVDGTWVDGDPGTGTAASSYGTLTSGKTYIPFIGHFSASSTRKTQAILNFGQDHTFAGQKSALTTPYTDADGNGEFYHQPPSGFVGLYTTSPPTTRPTRRWGGMTGRSLVEAGAGTPAFKAVTWAGDNGTNRGITGVGFEPGLVWLKNRDDNVDTGSNHMVFDAVRGATKYLQTDNTDPEETNANSLKSFDADGFTIGALQRTNTSGKDYVAWCLKAGGAGVSNPTGSITSTVSANTAAGFSVVEYTGNETAGATVGHGLGSAPDMIIVKDTDTTDNWAVYHSGLGGGNAVLFLESTAGVNTSLNMWDSTTPSSSVITLGDRDEVNRATAHIAYCFHSVPGFSKIGSYSGSASSTTSASENNYIALGFRPAFIMFKRATSADDWIIVDNARDPDNSTTTRLRANSFALEDSNAYAIVDFNDSGFTLRGGNAGLNYTGNTYIYMAFAEEIPGADAIPTTGVLSLAEHYQSKL